MSRDDLLQTNARIVTSVAERIKETSPHAIVIIVSNPLDAMAYQMWNVTGFPTHRVIGQAGVLDAARFRTFLAMELGVSVEDTSAMLFGRPRRHDGSPGQLRIGRRHSNFATRRGGKRLEEIIDRTRKGGAEIVGLVKTSSAYFAPAAATAQMVEAVVRDKKRVIPLRGVLRRRV